MGMNLKEYKPPTQADMRSWQDEMRAAFFEGVGPDDMREIVQKLVKDAKAGDKTATRILLNYGIGAPQVHIKNAVVIADRQPLPAPPSRALPGTTDRVDDMAKRAARGQEIFSKRDRKAADA